MPINILRPNVIVKQFEKALLERHQSSNLLKQNGLLGLDTINKGNRITLFLIIGFINANLVF